MKHETCPLTLRDRRDKRDLREVAISVVVRAIPLVPIVPMYTAVLKRPTLGWQKRKTLVECVLRGFSVPRAEAVLLLYCEVQIGLIA